MDYSTNAFGFAANDGSQLLQQQQVSDPAWLFGNEQQQPSAAGLDPQAEMVITPSSMHFT